MVTVRVSPDALVVCFVRQVVRAVNMALLLQPRSVVVQILAAGLVVPDESIFWPYALMQPDTRHVALANVPKRIDWSADLRQPVKNPALQARSGDLRSVIAALHRDSERLIRIARVLLPHQRGVVGEVSASSGHIPGALFVLDWPSDDGLNAPEILLVGIGD